MKLRFAVASLMGLVGLVPVWAQTTPPTTAPTTVPTVRSQPLRSALTYPANVSVVIDAKIESHDLQGKLLPVQPGYPEAFKLLVSRRSTDRIEILQAVPERNRIVYDGNAAYVEIEGRPARMWHPLIPTADRILETAGAMAAVNVDRESIGKLLRSDALEWLGTIDSLRPLPDVVEEGRNYARYTLSKKSIKSLELWIDRDTGRLARVLVERASARAVIQSNGSVKPAEVVDKADYRFSDWDVTTAIADEQFQFRGDSTWGNAFFDMPPSIKVGDVAPDFELPTLKKAQFALSDHKGSPLVLYFWRVGVGVDQIAALRDQSAAAKVDFMPVNRQNHGKDVREAFAAQKLTDFDTVMDHNSTVFVAYGSPKLPQAFVLDGASVVLFAGSLDTDPDREAFAAALKKAAESRGKTPATLPDI